MKAAKLFVKCLELSDIEYIFGLPGEENLALLDEISKSKIKFITTRDEQSAVFMAATVGRLTGRVGVALSTLGPGATNLMTGVAFAQLGAMPLMVITGQKPIKKSKQGKFQIIDVVGMMKPLTKMAETLMSADKIPATIYQAIRLAEAERPGAVHLELPEDIADEETTAKPIEWKKVRRPITDQKSIDQVLDLIHKSTSPIIILGASANRKLVRKQAMNFISKTKIPFVTTQMGKGVIDESSTYYLGTTALSSGDLIHKAIEAADLILMVGHDIVEKPPTLAKIHHKLVHINFYPADIDEVYKPDLEVIGDISHTLWSLTEQVKIKNWDFDYFYKVKIVLDKDINEVNNDQTFPIKPQKFVKILKDNISSDSILSLDNGMYKLWIARNYPAHEQNSVLLDNALATMGAGLPVGIAAKILNPKKNVLVVAGDGGIMMNIADLETAIRLSVDLVIIILNDSGFGMIKWKQESMKLNKFGLDFKNPNFTKLAESFGAKGYKIKSTDEFEKILELVINKKGVHIIDLAIDYSENEKLNPSNLAKLMK